MLNNFKKNDKTNEQKIITKCLLKGMTLKQIAIKLNCSKSAVSYKARVLFREYQAHDRFEFCINIFSRLIIKYKNEIEKLKQELMKFKTY